jgi:hypothetical protein
LVEERRNSNNIISFKSHYLKLELVQSVPWMKLERTGEDVYGSFCPLI